MRILHLNNHMKGCAWIRWLRLEEQFTLYMMLNSEWREPAYCSSLSAQCYVKMSVASRRPAGCAVGPL